MKIRINFFEIPATDFKRAVAFYNGLLGVELRECDMGDEKMAFFPEDDVNIGGAVSLAKGFDPSTDGVVVYFDAGDGMDDLIAKTVELGGGVLTGKTPIDAEGRGYFALLKDTEGNRFGLYSG